MSQQQTNFRKNNNGGGGGSMSGRNGAMAGRVRLQADTGKTAKRLLAYLGKGYIGLLILALACMAVDALVSVKSAMFIGNIIDKCIEPMLLEEVPNFAPLIHEITVMACIFGVGVAAALGSNMIMVGISQGVLKSIRNEMFAKMQTLPVKFFDTHPFGDTMSRFTNDTDSMRQMMSQTLPQVFSSSLSIISTVCAMIVLSPALMGVQFLAILVIYMITMAIGGRSAKYYKDRSRALGSMNAYIEEMTSGQKVVKVFCHEDKAKAGFDVKNAELREQTTKANSFSNSLGPINMNLGNLQYVILAIVGGYFALHGVGGLTLGNLASFLALSKGFTRPVSMISQQINSVVMALAGASRVFALMDEKSEEDDGDVTLVYAKMENGVLTECKEHTGTWAWKVPARPEKGEPEKLVKLEGDVTMKDVDFGYEEGKPVLHDISLYAKPGQKIAFVGSTGAGKTTITNLINRFYDIEDGKIRYDGININKIKKADLRRSLGIVLQDTNLFTGTIKENIRYGRPDATDEEVYAAAKLANADYFISRLPEGYDTVISGTGSQLSQGQCQLLAIARCAVADPPVMILDEATSSIDTRTESHIQEGMDRLMEGRTVFVIAHRLSTIQNSNAIMVMEKGRIIERGDHDDLLAQKGRYYQLYTGKPAQ